MGLFDKLLAGAGAVVAGAVLTVMYKDAQETKRRKSSPPCFDDGLSQSEFTRLAREAAVAAPRVQEVHVKGMSVIIHVRSNSGLSTWTADIDFNDFGHLTGTYWIDSENSASTIPEYVAQAPRGRMAGRVAFTH